MLVIVVILDAVFQSGNEVVESGLGMGQESSI